MSKVRGGVRELNRWLKRMSEKVAPEQVAQLHAKVHIQVGDGVILDTPVGNPSLWESPPPPNYVGGRARGNWQSTIGSPAANEINRIDPSGSAATAETQLVATAIRVGEVSYITNNVPYIERLNDGWSSQAPEAFVETNIMRVAEQLR